MKIKIVFVIIAVIFMALGATVGSIVTHNADEKNFAKIEKIYKEQNQNCRTDLNTLASKARVLIENKLYIRKVKDGKVTFDPASTMDIGKIIDTAESEIEAPIIAADTIKKKTFWDRITGIFK